MLSNKPSIPRSFNAEIKWNLAKSRKYSLRLISRFTCSRRSSLMPSHLLTATTKARPASKAKPAIVASWSAISCCASNTKTATFAASTACMALITENFSTASSTLPRRRTPAVSMMVNGLPSRSKSMWMLSRVVPAISKAITRSSPRMAFTKVDLPTFGRPITAKTGCFASSSSFSGSGKVSKISSIR